MNWRWWLLQRVAQWNGLRVGAHACDGSRPHFVLLANDDLVTVRAIVSLIEAGIVAPLQTSTTIYGEQVH